MAENDITGHISMTPEDGGKLAGTVRVSQEDINALGPTKVALQRSATEFTEDLALWTAIRNRTDAIGFNRYNQFIERLLCEGANPSNASTYGLPTIGDRRTVLKDARVAIHGPDAYNLLRLATEAFLFYEAGVRVVPPKDVFADNVPADDTRVIPGEQDRTGQAITFQQAQSLLQQYLVGSDSHRALPYLERVSSALVGLIEVKTVKEKTGQLVFCDDILTHRLTSPSLLELIWSYWHEQGMLVQTIYAIALRFQNRRSSARDPLAHLEIDPLRPLNHLLWGFIQDEYGRLSVQRRAYEYDHQ
jgi:hypothetical protein